MIKFLDRIRTLVAKDATMENKEPQQSVMYTEEQLMARLKFFIGICLALTLTGIVFVVLYSIIFVTQPLNAISPIDQKFFELIIPIATFLTGTLSGIMLAGGSKEAQAEALKAANKGWDRPPTTPSGGFSANASIGGSNFGITIPSGGSTTSSTFAPAVSGSNSFANAAPSAFGAAPAAAAMGAAAMGAVCMSSTGKPMPAQEEEPEL
jgi:hypothetical protein